MVNGSFLVVIYLTLVSKIIPAEYNQVLKQVYSVFSLLLIYMSHLKGEGNHQKRYCGRMTLVAPLLKLLQFANSF